MADHTEEQIRDTMAVLLEESRRAESEPGDLAAVARRVPSR
jgi:hypothetical protein